MSNGLKEDWNETLERLKNLDPIDHDKPYRTWLRHMVSKQSGQIDQMLLEGKYTVEEMAERLHSTIEPEKTLKRICDRVREHIDHLQEGDVRDLTFTKTIPHRLKLSEVDGVWRFELI